MGLWAGSNAKPYIERVWLNERPHIEPVKLNIKNMDFSDFTELEKEMLCSFDVVTKVTDEFDREVREKYELFVLSELHKRGYDLLRLENSECCQLPIDSEQTQYYVDGILVFTARKKIGTDNSEGKYILYADFEVED